MLISTLFSPAAARHAPGPQQQQHRAAAGFAIDSEHDVDSHALQEAFGALVQLQWIDLKRNKLVRLPESIGELVSLRHLDLSFNKLTYAGPRTGACVTDHAGRCHWDSASWGRWRGWI